MTKRIWSIIGFLCSCVETILITFHLVQYMITSSHFKMITKYLEKQNKLFEIYVNQTASVVLPFGRGNVTTTFDKTRKGEICASVETIQNFSKSKYCFKTYSDEQPFICFLQSSNVLPNFSTYSLISRDLDRAEAKAKYIHKIGPLLLKQIISMDYNKKDFNIDPSNPIQLKTSTRVFNGLYQGRLDTFNNLQIIKLEGMSKKWLTCGANFAYSTAEKRIIDFCYIASLDVKRLTLSASGRLIVGSMDFSAKGAVNDRLKLGLSMKVENIGVDPDNKWSGADWIGSAAVRWKIDDGAVFRTVINSDLSASCELKVKYMDFLKMKFTCQSKYQSISQFDRNFGAEFKYKLF